MSDRRPNMTPPFVVGNEQRNTLTPRYPELENRSFVVKVNRLFRF